MNTLIVGQDVNGTNRPVRVGTDGKLDIGATFTGNITLGTVEIDQTTAHANEVVVKTSALPADAATQTTVAAILAKLIAAPATSAKQDTGNTSLASMDAKITAVNTGAVVVASSALPTGAASETTLAALNAKVTAVNTGAVVVASGAITANVQTVSVASAMSAASLVVKASAGTLFSLTGYNAGPAQFLQVHNAATLPANAAVPLCVVSVPAQSNFSLEWKLGLPCSTGIVFSNSSTAATKTIGSADCHITATFA